MSDQFREPEVRVNGGERVAARDYFESREVNNVDSSGVYVRSASVVNTGSVFYVGEAQPTPPPTTSDLGECRKCHMDIWIHARSCPHCAYDPQIEAQIVAAQNEQVGGRLLAFWAVASCGTWVLCSSLGLTGSVLLAAGPIVATTLLIGGMWLWHHPPTWLERLKTRFDS